MTQKETIAALARLIESTLEIAPEQGKKVSVAYEAGMYIGALKVIKSNLEELLEKIED